jgi:hypothetical protein
MPSSESEDEVEVPVADRVEYPVQNTFLQYYINSRTRANGVAWWPYCFFSNQGFDRRVIWEVAFIRGTGAVFNVTTRRGRETHSTHTLFDAQAGDTGDVEEDSDSDSPPGTHWKASKKDRARYKQKTLSDHDYAPVLDSEQRVNERSQLFINLYIILYHWAKYDSMNIDSDALVVSGPDVTDIASCVLRDVLLYPRMFSVVECLHQWGKVVGVDTVDNDLKEIAENMFGEDGPVFAALTGGESRMLGDAAIKRRYTSMNERAKAILRKALDSVFGGGTRIGTAVGRQNIVSAIRMRLPFSREAYDLKHGDTIKIKGLDPRLSVLSGGRDMPFFPMFNDSRYSNPVYDYPRQCMFVMTGPVVTCSFEGRELKVAPGLSPVFSMTGESAW